jgi:hypothetical protein
MRIETIKKKAIMLTTQLYPWMYVLRNAGLVFGLYVGQYYG